jgi:hypothetical protein
MEMAVCRLVEARDIAVVANVADDDPGVVDVVHSCAEVFDLVDTRDVEEGVRVGLGIEGLALFSGEPGRVGRPVARDHAIGIHATSLLGSMPGR